MQRFSSSLYLSNIHLNDQVLLSINMEWIFDLFLLYTVHPQEKRKGRRKKRKENSLDTHFDILAPEEITLLSYVSTGFLF